MTDAPKHDYRMLFVTAVNEQRILCAAPDFAEQGRCACLLPRPDDAAGCGRWGWHGCGHWEGMVHV